jgi:hypothetical protein
MTDYEGYAIFPNCNCPEIVCVQKHGAGYNDIICGPFPPQAGSSDNTCLSIKDFDVHINHCPRKLFSKNNTFQCLGDHLGNLNATPIRARTFPVFNTK